MAIFTRVMCTMVAGIAGGLLFNFSKIPNGALIGSMLFVAAYNVKSGSAYLPTLFTLAVQILAGIIIGVRVTKETVLCLHTLGKPAFIMVIAALMFNLIIGFIFFKFTDLDITTSLFASAPAGTLDTTLAADAMGADTPKVAVLHLVRLVCVISFLPILKWIVEVLIKVLK